jgi:GDP-mannose 6-dehydrogenase
MGADLSEAKVRLLEEGRSPIVEPGLDTLVAEALGQGRFRATLSTQEALARTDVAMICVGTPNRTNGALSLDAVHSVAADIGCALRHHREQGTLATYPVVVVRSTVVPGTLHRVAEIVAQTSGLVAGEHFGVAANPEFLREGSAIADFRKPPYTLVGTEDARAAAVLREMYAPLDAEFIQTATGPAELLKFINNSWHALKVAFANEVGATSRALGVDSHQVMELFCRDQRLNISAAYMRPGFAYGGSCLPKDLAALNHLARSSEVSTPILAAVAQSNADHISRAVQLIQSLGLKHLGILGLSFKPGTDDLRESPTVELVQVLLGRGYKISIYDANVNLSRLLGANKSYIENTISHINELLRESLDEVLETAELLVVANGSPEFRELPHRLRPGQKLVDLVRIAPGLRTGDSYHGICW